MSKPRKHKLYIIQVAGIRIAFSSIHPAPDYFSVAVKGLECVKLDRKGLKSIAEVWVS